MRTVLICHQGSTLTEDGVARWLASFSELSGMVVLREARARRWRRIRREIDRSGYLGFVDVVAFRLYYALRCARRDRQLEHRHIETLRSQYPPVAASVPRCLTESPNTPRATSFLVERAPDLVVARCKMLIREGVFTIPPLGTFVFHPGICPEYRNSHGCFWALANGEPELVGLTVLQIDRGVDTGPVYGYFRCDFDAARESHIAIQNRLLVENLPAIKSLLLAIGEKTATPIDTNGRRSGAWGQPRLTSYLKSSRRAHQVA
jgi:Formyl transferase